jgi:hypothetical protein
VAPQAGGEVGGTADRGTYGDRAGSISSAKPGFPAPVG